MKRGEVRWYRFASPDQRRPVVILTRDVVLGYLSEVTVAPVSRTIRGIPSEVTLTVQDGMPVDCAVNCDHLQTVDRSSLGNLITTLGHARQAELARAVAFALDLSVA